MSIRFKIVTPERTVLEETADLITLPAKGGEITILPGHIPLVSLLETGVITVRSGATERHPASSGGFVEVLPDSQVTIFADSAERTEELTLEAVEAAKKRAGESLKEKRLLSEEEYAATAGVLERELARLKAVRRRHARGQAGTSPQEDRVIN